MSVDSIKTVAVLGGRCVWAAGMLWRWRWSVISHW